MPPISANGMFSMMSTEVGTMTASRAIARWHESPVTGDASRLVDTCHPMR
jgi:hypothetical protein